MTLVLDPSGDLAIMDGLQSVTISQGDDSGDSSTALPGPISVQEAAASNGEYTISDVRYLLPVADLDFIPRPGGTLTDSSGVTYVILSARRDVIASRWNLICRDLAITEDETTLITIQQASYSKDAGGAQVETWSDWQTDVRAKIQRISGSAETEHNKRDTRTTFVAYLETQHLVGRNHRVIDSDENVYRVLGYHQPDRIDALFEIDLTEW